jgi:phosphoribosylglycinamide formyltransferase-1
VRVAVLASGRGSNFDALARAASDPSYPARIVLLASDRADAGALELARRRGIPTRLVDPGTSKGVWAEEGVHALLEALEQARAEAVCLAGFMRVVPRAILAAHPERILNVHPSLLPAFPGLRAQRQALRAGVRISGCTVHFVDEGIDTGPIVLQSAVPVLDGDDEETLSARILVEEHRIYPEALRLLAEGRLEIVERRVLIRPARPRVGASPGGIS